MFFYRKTTVLRKPTCLPNKATTTFIWAYNRFYIAFMDSCQDLCPENCLNYEKTTQKSKKLFKTTKSYSKLKNIYKTTQTYKKTTANNSNKHKTLNKLQKLQQLHKTTNNFQKRQNNSKTHTKNKKATNSSLK